VSLFAQTTRAAPANPTDIYALAVTPAMQAQAATTSARADRVQAVTGEPTDEMRERASENMLRVLERRVPGWTDRMTAPPAR
jgi:hypothetical protein